MNIYIIIFLAIWYLSGATGYIITKRYYSNVTILDIVLALTLGGMLGFITLYFCAKHWYGYDLFSQVIIKKIDKGVPKTK